MRTAVAPFSCCCTVASLAPAHTTSTRMSGRDQRSPAPSAARRAASASGWSAGAATTRTRSPATGVTAPLDTFVSSSSRRTRRCSITRRSASIRSTGATTSRVTARFIGGRKSNAGHTRDGGEVARGQAAAREGAGQHHLALGRGLLVQPADRIGNGIAQLRRA